MGDKPRQGSMSAAQPQDRQSTACILCSRNCGLEVEIEDGRFVRVRGDPRHPNSRGYLCQKAARLDHYQNHADRLRHPLKRQPDGTFAPIGWDQALAEIAGKLLDIRNRHGGDAFAFVGGGGQGNHLGSAYGRQLLPAMGSRFAYNSLGQEKTGDFWVNGRLFGSQSCHTTEDVEHADYVLFIGCNPFQSHGIPRARDLLRDLQRDPQRTMVVIDPRRTETAQQADIHLQLRPGTDAYLMAALLTIIVRENLHDRAFLDAHCTGFAEVEQALRNVPVDDYVRRADVPLADAYRVARGFAAAKRACVRVDLGTQHTLHTTLNAWLEKLLYLVTGNFGREGGNNLHTLLFPLIGNTDERRKVHGKPLKLTAHHRMQPIAGIYPPNILPDEILHPGADRLRAVFVDSCNPLATYADTAAFEKAFASLELLVVVDVAKTETTALAHYVLPASSQFEKWEATGFNLDFPENYFHLRRPLSRPRANPCPKRRSTPGCWRRWASSRAASRCCRRWRGASRSARTSCRSSRRWRRRSRGASRGARSPPRCCIARSAPHCPTARRPRRSSCRWRWRTRRGTRSRCAARDMPATRRRSARTSFARSWPATRASC